MKATPSKREILTTAMQSHESVMNDFRDRIKAIENSEVDVDASSSDKYSASQRIETIAEMNLLKEQLVFASHEWDELLNIEAYCDIPHERVEFGSVVVTDHRNFFVSASIEDFAVGNFKLFGLSVHTPLYKAMRGRRVGERFAYGGTTYEIKAIY